MPTDAYTLNQSYTSATRKSVEWGVKKRNNMKVIDSQNGSYSGNVSSFDLSSISNSGLWLDWASTEFVCPITIEVDRAQGTSDIEENRFLACLKSNYALVDSISLTMSGFPVINQQKMNCGLVAYEMAKSWSKEDYERSSRFGMSFEDATQFQIGATGSAYSVGGVSSTSVLDFDPSATSVPNHMLGQKNAKPNLGRKARCEQTYYPSTEMGTLKDVANVAVERRSYMESNTPTKQVFYINARMSLAHLHSYFRTAVLSRNGLYRLEFYLNLATKTDIVMEGGATALDGTAKDKSYKTVTTTTSNQYNPLSLGSLAAYDGCGPMADTEKAMTINMKVSNPHETACFLNVSLIDLSVGAIETYIAEPIKSWEYEKHLFRDYGPIGAGDPATLQLSANMSRVLKIIMLPYYTNKEIANASSDLLSPFVSVGSNTLTSVGASVSQLQCQISGVNLYQNAITEYKDLYDMFKVHTLNNGVDTAINTSPVNMEQFQTGYGAIVIDCTKGQKESDFDLSKSYNLTWVNNTKKECRYLTYLVYSGVISQNVETGEIIV